MYVGYVTICKYYDDYLFVFETDFIRLFALINANILLILYVKNDSNRNPSWMSKSDSGQC